jgi:hypothetical protein
MSNDKKVTVGSGNVFADLGFANPEEELLKASLFAKSGRLLNAASLPKLRLRLCLASSNPMYPPLLQAE